MKRLMILSVILFIAGCGQENEEKKSNEQFIKKVNQYDWRASIPLDGLEQAGKLCRAKPDLAGCDKINFALQDISNGYATCHDDQRSMLCQDVMRQIDKHPIVKILPSGQSYSLPNTFWYWSLPTRILESSAAKYEFRSETASWWWKRNRVAVMVAIFTLITLSIAWIYRTVKRNNAIAIDAELKRKESNAAEFEQNRKNILEKNRERERKEAERVRQAEIANQVRMNAEKIAAARKMADEAAALKILEQKKREKEETERLLDAVFTAPLKKRKNRIGQASEQVMNDAEASGKTCNESLYSVAIGRVDEKSAALDLRKQKSFVNERE